MAIGSRFDNLISNLKQAGQPIPMQALQAAMNREFGQLKSDNYKIMGIEQAWQRLQEKDNIGDTAVKSLEELEKLNTINEETKQLLQQRLPLKQGFQ